LKRKKDYLFKVALIHVCSIFILVMRILLSLSKSKNLERRLNLLAEEAISELNKVCESSLWESLGFVYFDQLDSKDKIAKANFYYGQLQTINEIKLFSN
tara:strand:+ start:434 stop:730 length:297 start_codon:yes stop_codon:yes gene_type:complete